MELTHTNYEESMTNPECDPAEYNPATSSHRGISWMRQAATRDGYETVCSLCNVTPRDDAEITENAYRAEYTREQWLKHDQEWRVLYHIGKFRLQGIKDEPQVVIAAPEMVRCNCGHSVARSDMMTTSSGTSCPDCYDRMSE